MAIESLNDYKKRLKNNKVQKTTRGIESLNDFGKKYNIKLEYNNTPKQKGTGLFKGTEAFKGVTSAFNDGYQFGDGLKTALKGYKAYRKVYEATSRDLATNIAKGFGYSVEGMADALQYGTAWGLDVLGADKAAKAVRKNADFNSFGAIFGENEKQSDNFFKKGWTKELDKNSVIGDFGDTVAQGVGNIAAMAGGSYLLGGSSMSTAFTSFSSGYGNTRSEAARNGLDDKSAHKAGVISGFAEAISEQIFDGMPGTKTAGWANKLTGKIGDGVTKFFNEKTGKIVFKALNTMGEGTEEVVSNALNTLGSSITHLIDNDFTYGMENSRLLKDGYQFGDITKDTFDSAISQESLEAFISSTLTSCIINGGKNVMSNTQKNKIINAYAEDNGISFKEAKNQLESAIKSIEESQISKNLPLNEKIELQEKIENTQLENMRKSVFAEELEKYKANEQEFINTAKQYNIDTNNDTIKGINRMLSQRNIKATWNDKMFTSNNQDAVWIPKSDGTREIVFNPNADTNKLLENVAVHELYHDLAKSNNGMKIKAEILEFAKTKEGYEEARINLEEVYSQVYDKNSKEFKEIVDEEAVANILGNKLGDQKFVNQLTMEKPSLSRQIYNWVVNKINVLNKATGYKNEKLFWEDIKNKFENAYREDYVSSNTTDEKYMMVGKTGAKELIKSDSKYSWLKESYLKANQLKNNPKYNNEMIRQETGWFQDKEGNWEFEISDRNTKVKITPSSNQEYKLSDIFEAKTLYAMYPELKDINVIFKKMDTSGRYTNKTKTISINNNKINDLENIRGTLLHEIQHYIQRVEGFPKGTTILFGNEQYANSKGETEAADTRKRMDYTLEQRKEIIPESSKKNPTHPNREVILKHKRNAIEKIAEKLYNILGDDADEIFEENIEKTNKENIKQDDRVRNNQQSYRGFNDRIEELDNSSFSYGNLPKVKDGYTRLYRGLKSEYNPNYDRTVLDSPNGYDTLTDSYELAKRYGDKVYYIDIPTEQIGNSVIDENPNSETYGDRYLAYKDDKPASLDGIRGNEYLLYTDHDDFNSTNYKKIESSSTKLVDNEGRTLTKKQQEYFKDSKVRDEKGNLLKVYHGTPNGGFTIFDRNKTSRTELKSQFGTGFYFTNDERAAKDYNFDEDVYGNIINIGKPQTYTTYLNIENPLMLNVKNMNEHNLDRNKIKELLLRGDNDYFFDNYISFITQTPDALNYKVDGLSREEINNLSKEDRVDYWLRGTYDLKNFGDKEFLKTMHRAYKNNSDLIDNFKDIFGYDGIIVEGAGNTNQYIAFDSSQIKNVDNLNPTDNPDIRYSLSEAPKQDNEGRTLTKKQQEHFKDSKVKDENNNLTTVYHTTTDRVAQFNIFNPVGTNYYRFGDQVVNYYTSNKNMSGSYANQNYKMAESTKINNIDEAFRFVDKYNNINRETTGNNFKLYNNGDGTYTLSKESMLFEKARDFVDNLSLDEFNQMKNNIYHDTYEGFKGTPYEYALEWDKFPKELQQKYHELINPFIGTDQKVEIESFLIDAVLRTYPNEKIKTYDNIENMMRNLGEDIEKNDFATQQNLQYEGYLNISNPYIVDAYGENWDSVSSEIPQNVLKEITKITDNEDIKNGLIELANKSVSNHNELYTSEEQEKYDEYRYKAKLIADSDLSDAIKTCAMFQFEYEDYAEKFDFLPSGSESINTYLKSIPFGRDETINNFVRIYGQLYKDNMEYGYPESYFKINYKNILGYELENINSQELFNIAYQDFRPEFYDEIFSENNTTNDVVNKVIEMNKNGENYDGIIFKNVVDYGGKTDTRESADVYVTFNSNQFKSVDNENPTNDADWRYSEEGEEWEQYLNDNFKSTGEGKKLKDIKLPMVEENLPYTEPEIPEENANELQTTVKDTIEVDLGEKSVLNNTINRNSIRSKESALKLANKWLNLKGNDKIDFKNSLDKYTKMSQEEILTNNSYDEIKNIVDRYSEQEIVFTEDDVKEIKKHIRNAKIKITDNLKSQITDYNDFRKSNFGKLKLAKEGTNIDVLWKELNDMYPYYFSEDIETETDMLYALSDFMSEDFSVTQRYTLDENEITEITNDVYETILDNTLNEEQRNKLIEKDNELKKMNVSDRKNIRTVESVIGTQDDYISTRAEELFEELKGLKKGVKASNELSQILNLGYRWSDIKATLSNIKWKPGEQTNSQNTNLGEIESTIKNMLNEEYENKVQELIFNDSGATDNLSKENIAKLKRFNYAKEVESLKDSLEETTKNIDKSIIEKEAEYENKKNKDTAIAQKLLGQISDLKIRKANIELDYGKRINSLTEKVKNFDVKEETRKMSRAEYKQTLKDNISPLIESAIKWKDKKFLGGLRYSREIAQRNMIDVAGETEGNAINEYVFNPIQEHEASKNRRIKEKFKIIKDLNLDLKEQYVIDGEKVGEDDLVRRYIENSISKIDLELMGANATKIIEAADTISKMLESIYIDLNNEFKKMGLPEIEHRKDYFPHAMEEKKDTFISKLANMVGIDITNQELPTEIAGRTDEFKPNRAWNGHFLRRTGEKTDTNAIGNLERYIAGTEDILAHTEDIQKVRTLSQELKNQFTSEETQTKIEAINNNESLSDVEKDELIKEIYKREDSQLSGLVTWLDDYANVLSNKKSFADRNMERKIGRNAYTSMANIESIIAGNTVGGNASVSLTNLAPIVQATATTKGEFMVKSALDVLKNDIRTLTGNEDTSIRDMSDFLTNRFGTDSIGRKTWKDKIKKIAFKPMEIVDNFTSEVIVRAKYYENLQKGMESSEAMKNADKYASKLMADRSKGALPIIFNEKNPMAKLITMFQVEPNNIISNYTKDMSRDSDTKGQLAYQYTKLAVGSYVFNSILMNIRGGNEVLPDPIRFVQYLIKAITGDDEEKEKAGEDMLESITGAVPFLSNVAGLLGMEDVGRIPISSALPDLTELVNLGDDEVSDEYKAQVLRDEILKPLSYFLLPTGAAQVWKTVQGLDAVANGGSYKYSKDGELKMQFPIENPDIIDYAKAGLFGKYSLDEAKTYIDSGFKTLTQKQAETYQEMNLPYAEYMEYIEGITEAKRDAKNIGESQTEAVYDYIYNLPLSDEDKNTLLNGNLGNSDTIKDDNGYIKYVDSRNKTYWYDKDNNELYNRNYHKVDVSKLEELTQYSNEKDITNYGDYDSLEEFNYANNNPDKYLAITQITDYKTFNEYKSYIQDIEDEYSELMATASSSKQKTAISNQKKAAIRKYINSLNLNKYQKLMLEKLGAGYSIKNYHSYLHSYINDLNVSKEEKETIDRVLFD